MSQDAVAASAGSSVEEQRADARLAARRLFELLARDDADESEQARARQQLVEQHLPLVRHLAMRFRSRGEPLEDLIQVGTIGLIKAVDRFDLERGVEFSTYATPTIVGEIKRHFRDKGWMVRVPRRLQELRLHISMASQDLNQSLGRAPTVAELAERIGVTEEDVLEGLESAQAYSTVSLDTSDREREDAPSLGDLIGDEDAALENVEDRETLRPLLAALPPRERQILSLRFFRGMTQSQIAAEVGISQMHVSRLLAKTLAELRTGMLAD